MNRTQWPLLNRARLYGVTRDEWRETGPRVDPTLYIPMNIQYAWDTFPPYLEAAFKSGGYVEALTEKVVPLIQGSNLRSPFPKMWFEWTRGAFVMKEGVPTWTQVDCAVLFGEHLDVDNSFRAYLTWENKADRDKHKHHSIPVITAVDVSYDLLAPGCTMAEENMRVYITGAGRYLFDDENTPVEEVDTILGKSSRELMWAMFWSWLLLSCNNVTTVESQPCRRTNKRQKDPSRVVHRELHVQVPPGGNRAHSVSEGDEKAGTAFHVRRGHFADYTQGKGLFGKYHGKYWVPSMTVGDVDYGTVLKNYKLEGVN